MELEQRVSQSLEAAGASTYQQVSSAMHLNVSRKLLSVSNSVLALAHLVMDIVMHGQWRK